MSSLDVLYKNYRIFCKKEHPAVNEILELILYDDGSGKVQRKSYCPTEANPFKVVTEDVIRFKSPGTGATKLGKLNEALVLEQETPA